MSIFRRRVILLALLAIAGCGGDDGGGGAGGGFDRYGGWLGLELQASGRFRVERVDGRWWFVTPDGHPFFSTGVQVVSPRGDLAADGSRPYRDTVATRYASDEEWAEAVVDRLEAAGLNTIGDFSDRMLFREVLPYTPGLGFAARAPVVERVPPGFTGKALRDYFAPEFADGAREVAESARPCAEDSF